MKILSIGNSYSQDAHRWIHDLAKLNGLDIYVVNLMIGGCSLETHWQNVEENKCDYDLEINGKVPAEKRTTISEMLCNEKWDIITIQQASRFSGKIETYEPYISNLVNYITERQPNAKLYFHRTWAYEIDFDHPWFPNYDCDQIKMFNAIMSTTQEVLKKFDIEIIPVGETVQYVRENVPEFDYKNGGLSLLRDGLHLSYDYGRFLAAAVWIRKITGIEVKADNFQNFDRSYIEKILKIVNDIEV